MVLQIFWNVDPEIFKFGGISLRYYSVLFAIAFLLGYRIISNIYKLEGINDRLMSKLLIYVIVGTIIGARLGHTLFYEFDYYKNHLLEIILPFKIQNGKLELTGYQGLASHGGALGILMAVWLYSRNSKLNMLWILDRLVITVALAGFFIRIGNFFNSEIIGSPSSLPWSVVFAKVDLVPRHPAQLYEALSYFIFFLVLYYLHKTHGQLKRGILFGLFLLLTFSARIFIEFVKENQVPFENALPLNMGQLLSIPFIIIGICFIVRRNSN